jgi:colanic acid/amylovoran biosynthesis glycosyltransferase
MGMHLIYVTAALPLTSGETFITTEILEVQKRGHRVTLVPVQPQGSFVHEDARPLTGCSIVKPVLSLSIVAGALAEIVREPTLVLRSLRLLARSRNVRILIKNLAVLPKGLWLAGVVRQLAVDHIHAHWAGTTATMALVASVVSGVPLSLTAHRWDISERNLLEQKAEKATFVRAIDLRGAQELAGIIGHHDHKLSVIHMGVAIPSSGAERKGRVPGPLRVLLGARLVDVKGHRYALEATAQLKAAGVEISLQCAGEGPLRDSLEKHATALDVRDRVQFLGVIDHQELLNRLRQHQWDVVLLPSIVIGEQREGIPVSLIEAMAAGVVVVGTNTGGIPELLESGAGLLVGQRDARAVADALSRLAADDELRLQLAEAGIRRVRSQFAIESTTSALLDRISHRSGDGGGESIDVKLMEMSGI